MSNKKANAVHSATRHLRNSFYDAHLPNPDAKERYEEDDETGYIKTTHVKDDKYKEQLVEVLNKRLNVCLNLITEKNVNDVEGGWSLISHFITDYVTDSEAFATLFKHMIKMGADPNIKNVNGDTALNVAVQYYREGSEWMLEALLKAGAKKTGVKASYKERLELEYLYPVKGLHETLVKHGVKLPLLPAKPKINVKVKN